jgi:hypothetical protein
VRISQSQRGMGNGRKAAYESASLWEALLRIKEAGDAELDFV